ncbi:hypothetical protein M0811_00495 [Anaeramoeba ignava]|uniref:Uncharacterized protein n=1 Tax=Anaeramoeba ignava TaxID=1746090 RepID=A0A9Q0LSP6_ANAIG|nr:hypothetical protein M0811_00495 [Anaeramoeba ignava]
MLKYHEEKDSKNSEHHFLIFDFEKDFCSSSAKITFSQPFNQTCISQTKENLVFVLNSDSLAVLILNSATTNFVDSLLLFGKFELAEFFYQTNNWDSNTLWSERAINLALDYQDYSLIERALSKFPFEKQLVIIQKMISYTNSNFSKFRPNFLQNLINLFQQKILLSISQYSEKILAFFPLPNENVNHLNLQQILILFASNLDNSLSFLNTNHSNQEKMQMELHKISQSNSNALILRKISNMIQIHPLSIVEKPKKDSMEELQQKMNEQIFHFVSQSILSSEEFHTYSIPQFISQFISSGKFSELISILQFYKNQENPLNLESFFRKEIDFISNLKRFSFEVFYHLVETNQVKEAFDLINNCQIKKESDIANELLLFTKNSVVRNNLLPFLYKDLPNIQSINPFNHDSIQNDLNFLLFLSHYYPNEDYLYYFELKTQKNYTEFPEIWDIIMQKAFIFSSNLEINFQPKLEIEEDFSENLNCGDLIEKSHLQFKDILNDKSEETLKEITQEGYFAFNLASLQNIHLNKRKRIVIEALNFQEETFTRRMSFFENIENQQEWLLICLDYIISHGNVFELKHFLSYIDDNYELNSKEIQAIQLYFSRFAPHFLRILFQKWFFKLSSVISYSQNYLDLQYLKLLCYHSLIFSNNQKKMEKLNHFRFKIHQLFVNLCIENQLINGVLLLMKHSPISQELKNHLISFLSKQTQSPHIQYLIQIIEEKFDLILLNDAKQEISDLLNQKSGDSKDQKAKLLFASFILSQNPKSQREKVSKMIEKSKQKKLISFFCTKSFLEKSKRNKMKNSRENHLFTSRNDTSLSQLIKKINSLEIDEILSKSNPFEELKSFSKQKFDIPFYLINTQTIKAIKTIVMNQEKSKMEIIMQKLLKENEQFWFQITSRISHLNLLDNKVFSCCLSFISFCGFSEAKFIVNHSSSKIIFIHIYAQEIDKESPTKKEYSFSPKCVSSSIQKIANLFKPLLFNDSKSFKKHKFTVYEKLLQAKTWIEKNKQNMEPFIENGLFLRSFCDKEILDKIVNNFSKIYSIDSRIFSKMGNKYTRSDLENVCQSLDFINRNSDSTVNLEENIQNVVLKDHIKRFLPELFPNSKTIEKTSVHKQDDISSFSVENIINWALREKDSTQMLIKKYCFTSTHFINICTCFFFKKSSKIINIFNFLFTIFFR